MESKFVGRRAVLRGVEAEAYRYGYRAAIAAGLGLLSADAVGRCVASRIFAEQAVGVAAFKRIVDEEIERRRDVPSAG
jgi:hypothetical protein